MKLVLFASLLTSAAAWTFSTPNLRSGSSFSPRSTSLAALKPGERVTLIGVAADSGCGKSTFMRRLTNIFGGETVGPLGGGFDGGGWETNTLVSDQTTVICLDDFHPNDRAGRKVTKLTALNPLENDFDTMYQQLKDLKVRGGRVVVCCWFDDEICECLRPCLNSATPFYTYHERHDYAPQ